MLKKYKSMALAAVMALTSLITPVRAADEELKSVATVELSDPVVGKNMGFVDGWERNASNKSDPLYSEAFEMEGVKARKVYNTNYVYFTLDKGFYEDGDRNFIITVEYWDFGPDPGWFHIEYNSEDGTAGKRVSIQKTGKVQKWCTAQIFVTDADFGGRLPENADIRLVSNAYNAFSKITVINVDAAKRFGEPVNVGTVADEKAATLNKMGLYHGTGAEQFEPALTEKLTRAQAVSLLIDAIGRGGDAAKENIPCTFPDAPAEFSAALGYAQQHGIISGDADGKFYPDRMATVRELLCMIMHVLGYNGQDIWQTGYEKAYEIGMLENKDLILSADAELTRDNFVSCAYNMLKQKYASAAESVIERMVVNSMVDTESLKGTEFEGERYSKPTKIAKRTIYDKTAKREYYYMNIDGARAIRPYVTQQHWSSDGKKFLISNNIHQTLYEYNVETEELKKLDDTTNAQGSAEAVVTPDDKILYRKGANEVWLMDWKTGHTKKVADIPEGVQTSVFSVTHDGKYATCYWTQKKDPEDVFAGVNRIRIIPRLNIETGEWDVSLHHEFDSQPEFPSVGHPQICPTDPDLMMFCHEGTTQYIHDRIWLGDMNTKKTWQLFIQARETDAHTAETTGHEVWSYDGKEVYFVKYYIPSVNIGQQGIVRVDTDGKREYINGDYRYWHCYPSKDGNWVAADTQLGTASEIVLMNTNTYETHLLARFSTANNPQHPYQPHPVISYDGKYVSWQMVDEDGMLGVGWADISEFTREGKQQEHIAIPGGEILTHKDAASAITKTVKDGVECYEAKSGNGIFVNAEKSQDADKPGSLTISLTYLDNGRQPLCIGYTSSVKTPADLANIEDKKIEIQRTATGKWITKQVTLEDMNLSDACRFKTDFYITGSIYSSVFVKDIEISEGGTK